MTWRATATRWLLLGLAVADLVALKAGWVSHPPHLLALLFAACLIAFGVQLIRLVRAMFGRQRDERTLASILGSTGILLALLGGTVNWLLSLQGFVILGEREAVDLRGGTVLQAFDAGPLARVEEMGVHLLLDELELVPSGAGTFYPRSRLQVWRRDGEPRRLDLDPRTRASFGSLWFFQGAFGFAPRIVIVKNGNPPTDVFDRVVPFVTERHGPSGISFDGSFTIEQEQLRVDGVVDLASLDEGMRGHATLELLVTRDGELLGRGRLLPGHFAEIDQGYRVGFAGLQRWSEIVVSRRNYGTVVIAGAVLAALGALLRSFLWWRGG